MAAITATPLDNNAVRVQIPQIAHKRIQEKQISPALSLFAGGLAGGIEAAVTYPFEFAKTRAQLKGHVKASSNPFAVITQVARNNGVAAVYSGCSTLITGTAFKAGVRFLTFDTVKDAMADDQGKLSPARGMLAGVVAGCVESILAVTPTERIKTALIDDAKNEKRFRGGVHAFTTIFRESGFTGIYRGLIATCVKQSATSAVRMGTYNVLKTAASERQIQSSPQSTFAMGSIAGLITVYATQPFDTIKTRTQSAQGTRLIEAMRDILSTAGVKGFWQGSTMRLGRLIFSGGIVFTVYEQTVAIVKPLLPGATRVQSM